MELEVAFFAEPPSERHAFLFHLAAPGRFGINQSQHGRMRRPFQLWILDVQKNCFSPINQGPQQDHYGTTAK
jgi:hypothetical protein